MSAGGVARGPEPGPGGAPARPPLPPLPPLNARLPAAASPGAAALPERVLQFGEGNFLRAFVDWMLQRMNDAGVFGGRAVVVQPIPAGAAAALGGQDGRYTVILRGLVDGRVEESRQIVSSVSRALDPYRDFDAFLACAAAPELRFVVSNTTEAGIRRDPADRPDARPAPSFPGKLTQLLHARFRAFAGDPAAGLVMLPCELVEDNGAALRRAVLETATAWGTGPAFARWIDEACVFASTLVDRIVTGYPAAEAPALEQALGYRDGLMVAGEIFHAWVIEAPATVERELPFAAAGLNVTFTPDLRPYRERKVRILNGAHTAMAAIGLLDGQPTVRACMEDPVIGAFVARLIDGEIVPALAPRLPASELASFAAQVTERFRNPFIEHRLASIALNATSKYRARLLGTVRDLAVAGDRPPPRASFVLAALIALHAPAERGAGVDAAATDEPAAVELYRNAWLEAGPRPSLEACQTLAGRVLGAAALWGEDLRSSVPGWQESVAAFLHHIVTAGMRAALVRLSGLSRR